VYTKGWKTAHWGIPATWSNVNGTTGAENERRGGARERSGGKAALSISEADEQPPKFSNSVHTMAQFPNVFHIVMRLFFRCSSLISRAVLLLRFLFFLFEQPSLSSMCPLLNSFGLGKCMVT
jgi:hypothetical protein